MTKATDLSTAIETRLQAISQANGFATDVVAVYGFGERVPDKAAMPYLLVRLADDSIEQLAGTTAARVAQYQIEAVFSRAASLQDLQCCHHDILRTLGAGGVLPDRPLTPGKAFEESAEFDPDQNGSSTRRLLSTITLRYVEQY